MENRLIKSNNICPIIILPSYEKYEDRALMLSKIVEILGVGKIHFHNRPQRLPLSFSHIASYPNKNRSIYKWKVTLLTVINWMKIEKTDNKIIHDLFAPRGILLRRSKNTKKILSLYSDTANYYFGKRYKSDLIHKKLKNKISTHLLYIKRSVYEYIGIKLADGIIVNSPDIIDGIKKYYKIENKKFAVINTCVDTNFWNITGIERDKKLIFFAGRLCKRKGLDILFESYKVLVKRIPNLKLVIAGKETDEEDFSWGKEYIINNNLNVRFLGELNREDMRYWYNRSSILVLPSSQEGSPRVIKEAMACGCPVICTDLPGTRILDSEGSFLIFFPANDVLELTNKITNLICEYKIKSESLREFALKNFSPEIIANKNIQFYNELFKQEK